jgi:ribosomal protein L44E
MDAKRARRHIHCTRCEYHTPHSRWRVIARKIHIEGEPYVKTVTLIMKCPECGQNIEADE